MGVYPSSWATPLFFEAMKFWYCSLVMSITIKLMQLFKPQTGLAIKEKVTGEEEIEVQSASPKREESEENRTYEEACRR